jgi:hypothetical protein
MMHLNRRMLLKNPGIDLDGFSFLKIKKIKAITFVLFSVLINHYKEQRF